jgi:anaerobic ribonucleoside-triphosphate reductase
MVGDPLKIDWVEPEEIHRISYFPKVAVEYRLNDGKEEKENWTPGTDKTSASFSKGSFEKMLRAQTVEITAD